jgi:glycosyltransferase involved in cell wall biosynthesis
MDSMNILIAPAHYFFSDRFGSEPSWSCSLVQYIASRVSSVDVIVGVQDTDIKFPPNVRIYPVYQTRSASLIIEGIKYILFPFGVLFKALYLVSQKKYDVVHHMFPLSQWTISPLVIFLSFFKNRPKILMGPLQLPQRSPTSYDVDLILISKKGNRFSSYLTGSVFKFLMSFAKPVSKYMFRIADFVVCNSLESKTFYSKTINSQKLEVIPTGITPPDENLRIREKKHFGVRLLCVAQLTQRKGQVYLLEAVKKLVEKNINVVLTLVGEGDLEDAYREYISKNNLQKHVNMIGRVPHSKIGEIYQKHNLFCLPSISDPSPTVILEAMSYGLPIIASDVGAVKEMIGEGGIVIKPKDSEGLYRAVEKISYNPKMLQKMSKVARKRVIETYSWDRIADKWVKLYENI